MSQERPASTTIDAAVPEGTPTVQRRFTLPSVLSAIRLLFSPVLIPLAWADLQYWCLGLFVVLLLTDWLDGKLAIALNQRTVFGARLDTVADVTFYACVLVAVSVLKWEIAAAEAPWILAAVGSYIVSFAASMIKFHRMPSYHTYLAKSSWLLVSIAIISMFAGWSVWPLRMAMAAVFVTNVEAILITLTLKEKRVNVPSLWHASRPSKVGNRP
jgi:CDP-diacylglycerol--glycerol-3-phosphate 3-phosphatidyltransferase